MAAGLAAGFGAGSGAGVAVFERVAFLGAGFVADFDAGFCAGFGALFGAAFGAFGACVAAATEVALETAAETAVERAVEAVPALCIRIRLEAREGCVLGFLPRLGMAPILGFFVAGCSSVSSSIEVIALSGLFKAGVASIVRLPIFSGTVADIDPSVSGSL